jgi:hypothetical protein
MDKIKSVFEHSITLFGEIAILLCCCIWYFQSKEIEPLIGIIGSTVAIIISIFFRSQKSSDEAINSQSNVSNSKNTLINSNITVHQGGFRVGDNINQKEKE